MSEYIPYVPEAYPDAAQPDPDVQAVLQATYGHIMHAIKSALDPYVHELAEQAIVEFGYDNNVFGVQDYLIDLEESCWVEETAAEIAPPGAPRADIEMALKSILRASQARLSHAIRNVTADAVSHVQ